MIVGNAASRCRVERGDDTARSRRRRHFVPAAKCFRQIVEAQRLRVGRREVDSENVFRRVASRRLEQVREVWSQTVAHRLYVSSRRLGARPILLIETDSRFDRRYGAERGLPGLLGPGGNQLLRLVQISEDLSV